MQVSCLVVGQGSIGQRHARVLTEAGHKVAVASRRGGAYGGVPEALAAEHFDYVVVATETSDHARVVSELAAAGFTGVVTLEKPVFDRPLPFPPNRFADVFVGYTLRCHPALRRLKEMLRDEPVLSAQIYVGQYLPDWRPGRDYRATYSAKAAQGGGALRDLAHELDMAHWLFGPWQRVAAMGGHWSALEINSDDTFVLLAEYARCRAASIHLNYIDRQTRRQVVVTTAEHTYSLDFIARSVQRDREEAEFFEIDRDQVYRELHKAALARDHSFVCGLDDGLRAVAMVDAAERAARDRRWIDAHEGTS